MADGSPKPIGQVKAGDKVMAADPKTGRVSAQIVAHTWMHNDHLFELVVGGKGVATTEDHLFWDEAAHQWRPASQISAGKRLVGPDGRLSSVEGLRQGPVLPGRAYNLTVNSAHTYYVLAGRTPVLVHNDNGIPSVDNERLQNIVNALFHGVGNPNQVGDGSAMAAANAEALGGAQVEGRNHLGSTAQLRSSLVNFLTKDTIRERGGKKVPVVRSARDIQVANSLISAIDDAHAGRYSGLGGYDGLGGC